MYKSKMMIIMRRDLKMRKGKIASQAGHACIEAILMALQKEGRMNDFEKTDDGMLLNNTGKPVTALSEWFHYGCAKICVYVDSEAELIEIADKAKKMGIISAMITDAGMTRSFTANQLKHVLPLSRYPLRSPINLRDIYLYTDCMDIIY